MAEIRVRSTGNTQPQGSAGHKGEIVREDGDYVEVVLKDAMGFDTYGPVRIRKEDIESI